MVVIASFLGLGVYLAQKTPAGTFLKKYLPHQEATKDPDLEFFTEVFNTIKNNYWDKGMNEEALTNLGKMAVEKITSTPQTLSSANLNGLNKLINSATKNMNPEQRVNFVAQLSDMMLANLQPFGRSRLYSTQDETALNNEVKNISPEADRYADVGVDKSAPQGIIDQVYQKKLNDLKAQTPTPEVENKIAALQKDYQIIGDPEARQIYDQTGVEPTVEYQLISPRILHMHLNKFSPTTLQDLERVAKKFDQGKDLDTLIFDLRDNIGGLIDGLPYFLGPFIGNDQYAYQFFDRGEKVDYKTKFGWLPSFVRYKKVVVLINRNSQSSAEVFAAVLKKYNVGVLVGTTTKGWGTVEKVFSINSQPNPKQKYSVFLVHELTLREDGQPIEGKGVDPMINIASADWQQQLYERFGDQELVNTVRNILKPDLAFLAQNPPAKP